MELSELSTKRDDFLNRYLSGLEPGISRAEILKRRKALNREMVEQGMPRSWRKSACRKFTEAAKATYLGVDWEEVSQAEEMYFSSHGSEYERAKRQLLEMLAEAEGIDVEAGPTLVPDTGESEVILNLQVEDWEGQVTVYFAEDASAVMKYTITRGLSSQSGTAFPRELVENVRSFGEAMAFTEENTQRPPSGRRHCREGKRQQKVNAA